MTASSTTPRIELTRNAAGRLVPVSVNGKDQRPYQGANQDAPQGHKAAPPIRSCAQYPENGDKRVPDLETALRKCGLRNGMVISSHHHLGARDLMWFPSASFPSQSAVVDLMEKGVVHHIEGSMNGPLGDYTSQGKMRGVGVLRSHGGRWQAIQDGEVHIDIAVIAAPTADPF